MIRASSLYTRIVIASALTPCISGCTSSPARNPPTSVSLDSKPAAPSAVPATFTDVTDRSGIRFEHFNGTFGQKWMPETTGGGCAFLDFDRDGYEDILLV